MKLWTEKISKQLEAFVLRDISMQIKRGDYYVLLGKSGAGKTQLLELLCGLNSPDEGKIFVDGIDVTHKKVQDRNIGLVFQDFALFPHYTVRENIAYHLVLKKIEKKEIERRVEEAAREMNIVIRNTVVSI